MDSARQDGEQQTSNWPRPKAGDLCVGAIVWLPQKITLSKEIRCCCQSHILGPSELDPEGYNHPAVVLKISQQSGSRNHGDLVCDVACVSLLVIIHLVLFRKGRNKGCVSRLILTSSHFNRSRPLTPSPSQNTYKNGKFAVSNIQSQSSTRNHNLQLNTSHNFISSQGTYINNHTCALHMHIPFTFYLCVLSDEKKARRPIKLD